jgi:hypothetical protein
MALTIRGKLDRTFKQLLCLTMAAVAAAIALFFFSLAAFTSVSRTHDAIVASLVLGGGYLVLAAAVLIWMLIWLRLARRKEEEANKAAATGAAQLLQDPIVVSTGLGLLRALGSRRASPLAAALLAGVVIAASRLSSKSRRAQSNSDVGS